jgi:hypothetical protein
MDFIYAKVAVNGFLNVIGTKDWGRLGTGGENSGANMM